MGAETAFPVAPNMPAFLLCSHRTLRGFDLAFPDPPSEHPNRQPQNTVFPLSGFTNPSAFAWKNAEFHMPLDFSEELTYSEIIKYFILSKLFVFSCSIVPEIATISFPKS